MHVVLVTPPVANPFYPPLGLPSLAAFLRENSSHSCSIHDLSLEAVLHLLTRPVVEDSSKNLDARLSEFAQNPTLEIDDQPEYFRVARAATKAQPTLADLEHAVALFRDSDAFSDPCRRRRAVHVIDDAMEIVSAAHFPYSINRSEFICGDAPFSLTALVEGVQVRRSPIADFLESRLDDILENEQPSAVGISICYFGQLIAGLELARHIRRVRPDLAIIVGGSVMPEVGQLLASEPSLAELFDHVICYEGETALAALLDAIEAGRVDDFAQVPNRLDPGSGQAALRHRENMSALPTPDFSGFELDRYLSPRPILPLLTSRGCYWGACAFCTHFHTYGDDYRTFQGEQVADQIAELRMRFGCKDFYFVDESLAPSKARAIAHAMIDREISATWATEIRFERALDNETLGAMAQAGCRALSFGLESGSQRVLDLMNKGIAIADVDRVLLRCEEVGIAAHVMCIVGFPGETAAEVDETFQLLVRHRDRLALVGFSPFTLNVNSIAHRDPNAFGIEVLDTADILRPDRNFTVRAGIGQMEAFELYETISNSDMVRAIDHATALPTREHLLLIPPLQSGEPVFAPGGQLRIEHRVLPFSLRSAQDAHDDARRNKQAKLLGLDYPDRNADPLALDAWHVLYLPDEGRIVEVDDTVLERLQNLVRGEASFSDPSSGELFGALVGSHGKPEAKDHLYA